MERSQLNLLCHSKMNLGPYRVRSGLKLPPKHKYEMNIIKNKIKYLDKITIKTHIEDKSFNWKQ